MKFNHFPKLKNIFLFIFCFLFDYSFYSVDLFTQHLLFWRARYFFSFLLNTKTSRDTFTNIFLSLVCIVVHLLFSTLETSPDYFFFFSNSFDFKLSFQSFSTHYFISLQSYHCYGKSKRRGFWDCLSALVVSTWVSFKLRLLFSWVLTMLEQTCTISLGLCHTAMIVMLNTLIPHFLSVYFPWAISHDCWHLFSMFYCTLLYFITLLFSIKQ